MIKITCECCGIQIANINELYLNREFNKDSEKLNNLVSSFPKLCSCCYKQKYDGCHDGKQS